MAWELCQDDGTSTHVSYLGSDQRRRTIDEHVEKNYSSDSPPHRVQAQSSLLMAGTYGDSESTLNLLCQVSVTVGLNYYDYDITIPDGVQHSPSLLWEMDRFPRLHIKDAERAVC